MVAPSERKNLFGRRASPLPESQSKPVPQPQPEPEPAPMACASFPTGPVNPPNTAPQLRTMKSFPGNAAPTTPSATRRFPPLEPKTGFAAKLRSNLVAAGHRMPRIYQKINERMEEREAARKLEMARNARAHPVESVERARNLLDNIKAERQEEACKEYYRVKRVEEAEEKDTEIEEEGKEETQNQYPYTQGLAPSTFVEESTEVDESEFDSGSDEEGSLNELSEEVQPIDWASASYAPFATPAKTLTLSGGPKEPIVVDLISDSEDEEDDETAVQMPANQENQNEEESDADTESFATDSKQEEDVFPRRDSGSMEISEDDEPSSYRHSSIRSESVDVEDEFYNHASSSSEYDSISANSDSEDDETFQEAEGPLPGSGPDNSIMIDILDDSSAEDVEESPIDGQESPAPSSKATIEEGPELVAEESITVVEVKPEEPAIDMEAKPVVSAVVPVKEESIIITDDESKVVKEGSEAAESEEDASVGHYTALDLSLFGPEVTFGAANEEAEDSVDGESSNNTDTREMLPPEFVTSSDDEKESSHGADQQQMAVSEAAMDALPYDEEYDSEDAIMEEYYEEFDGKDSDLSERIREQKWQKLEEDLKENVAAAEKALSPEADEADEEEQEPKEDQAALAERAARAPDVAVDPMEVEAAMAVEVEELADYGGSVARYVGSESDSEYEHGSEASEDGEIGEFGEFEPAQDELPIADDEEDEASKQMFMEMGLVEEAAPTGTELVAPGELVETAEKEARTPELAEDELVEEEEPVETAEEFVETVEPVRAGDGFVETSEKQAATPELAKETPVLEEEPVGIPEEFVETVEAFEVVQEVLVDDELVEAAEEYVEAVETVEISEVHIEAIEAIGTTGDLVPEVPATTMDATEEFDTEESTTPAGGEVEMTEDEPTAAVEEVITDKVVSAEVLATPEVEATEEFGGTEMIEVGTEVTITLQTSEAAVGINEEPASPEAETAEPVEETIEVVDVEITAKVETSEVAGDASEEVATVELKGQIEVVDTEITSNAETSEAPETAEAINDSEEIATTGAEEAIEETIETVDTEVTIKAEASEAPGIADGFNDSGELAVTEAEAAEAVEVVDTNAMIKTEASEIAEGVSEEPTILETEATETIEETVELMDADDMSKVKTSETTEIVEKVVAALEGRVLRNQSATPFTGSLPVATRQGTKRKTTPAEGDGEVEEEVSPPAKKARGGRPRKAVPAKVEPPADRRNLRSRSTTPFVPSSVPIAAPARRPTKRKATPVYEEEDNAQEKPAKRAKGRPRKVAAAAAAAKAESVEPEGRILRSRSNTPFISMAASANQEEEDAEGEPVPEPKKAKGVPRKLATAPKQSIESEGRSLRGRSTTPFIPVATSEAQVDGEEKPAPEPKKARGRPRKAAAAVKAESVEPEGRILRSRSNTPFISMAASVNQEEDGAEEEPVPEPKKAKGRPRKAATAAKAESVEPERRSLRARSTTPFIAAVTAPTLTKPKRAATKKAEPVEEAVGEREVEFPPQEKKKSKGRPRKTPVARTTKATSAPITAEGNEEDLADGENEEKAAAKTTKPRKGKAATTATRRSTRAK